MESYNPFGRAGAGAPLRDAGGHVVANLHPGASPHQSTPTPAAPSPSPFAARSPSPAPAPAPRFSVPGFPSPVPPPDVSPRKSPHARRLSSLQFGSESDDAMARRAAAKAEYQAALREQVEAKRRQKVRRRTACCRVVDVGGVHPVVLAHVQAEEKANRLALEKAEMDALDAAAAAAASPASPVRVPPTEESPEHHPDAHRDSPSPTSMADLGKTLRRRAPDRSPSAVRASAPTEASPLTSPPSRYVPLPCAMLCAVLR